MKSKPPQSFYDNFRATFSKIFASIRKHYAELLEEEAKTSRKRNILTLVPLKSAAPLFFRQAREFSKIEATIAFTQLEKYKMRETLLRILRAKGSTLTMIDGEEKLYRQMTAEIEADTEKKAMELSFSFGSEIISVLKKHLEREYDTDSKEEK